MSSAIILISCPDQRGITATVTDFIFKHRGNILHADQHIDDQTNTFFMRIEWDLDGFDLENGSIQDSFQNIAQRFSMNWEIYFSNQVIRATIFVSRHLHCLYDLLYRHRYGKLPCEIPLVFSNHSDAREIVEVFGIDFVELHMTPHNKREQEIKQLAILKEKNIDLIILARYHQILSADFVNHYSNRIINIHHSFLPAFPGKSPYAKAYQRGVKVIGATSHYVTEGLDEGPIIEQDTVRVSHRDTLGDLKRKGEDLERVVLNRAVRWHLERKILWYNNKTVVFD